MAGVRADAMARAESLGRSLATLHPGVRPLFPDALRDLKGLLQADQVVAYRVAGNAQALDLDFLYGVGFPDLARVQAECAAAFARLVPGTLPDEVFHPRPAVCNRVTRASEPGVGIAASPVALDLLSRLGLARADRIRAILCHGSCVLATVTAFRHLPFGPREVRLLDAVVPALRNRLVLERHLGRAELTAAALDAALSAIPAAAFLVDADGAVLEANAAGRSRRDRDPAATRSDLAAALVTRGPDSPYGVTRLDLPDRQPAFLAVARGASCDIGFRLDVARRRWGLTARQSEVLELLARGLGNKDIARKLGSAESTVELHVTALLHKSGAESRTRLVARFWTELG